MQAAILFGDRSYGKAELHATVGLGHRQDAGDAKAAAHVPRQTLRDILQARRGAIARNTATVPQAAAEDAIQTSSDEDDGRRTTEQRGASRTTNASVALRAAKRSAEDVMDVWCVGIATEGKAQHSDKPVARRSHGTAVNVHLAGRVPQPLVGPNVKSAEEKFEALEAVFCSRGPTASRDRQSTVVRSVDAILDEECPFDEATLVMGMPQVEPRGRRSGRNALHNPTAYAVVEHLNREFESWQLLRNSVDPPVEDSIRGKIAALDVAVGLVALVVDATFVSLSLVASFQKLGCVNVSATLQKVVVVVDQNVYRNLHILVGADVAIGPCRPFPPTPSSGNLPVCLTAYCIRESNSADARRSGSSDFFLVPAQEDGGGDRPLPYDPLAVSQGRKVGEHLDDAGQQAASRSDRGSTTLTSEGVPIMLPSQQEEWHVPLALIESLVAAHRQQTCTLGTQRDHENESSEYPSCRDGDDDDLTFGNHRAESTLSDS